MYGLTPIGILLSFQNHVRYNTHLGQAAIRVRRLPIPIPMHRPQMCWCVANQSGRSDTRRPLAIRLGRAVLLVVLVHAHAGRAHMPGPDVVCDRIVGRYLYGDRMRMYRADGHTQSDATGPFELSSPSIVATESDVREGYMDIEVRRLLTQKKLPLDMICFPTDSNARKLRSNANAIIASTDTFPL